jgi:magnesium-transporting ATPase (P-type)
VILAAAAVVVKLVGQKIVKAHASQTMYMNHGLAMVIAMMVLTFQPTTVVMNAQQVLQFGLIVTSLIVMVVTVPTVAAAVDALQAKSKIAMVIAAQLHGLAMAIAMTEHTYGTEIRFI